MKCPVCAAENGPAANFCSNCGSPQDLRVCPHCETINSRFAAACGKCGQAFTSSGSVAATRTTAHGIASGTSSSGGISAVEGDTPSIKELLASLEKEVERQLAEDARSPSLSSEATPAETYPPSADRANSSAAAAPAAAQPAVEGEPLLARTGYDSPNPPSAPPLPSPPEAALPTSEPLLVASAAAEPEPRLSSEVFPIHEPPIASDTEPLRRWDVEPRPQEYRPVPSGRGKRVALAMLLVLLIAGGYAYYDRYGFDLQALKMMVQSAMAAKSATTQLSPPSADNSDSTSEAANAGSPAAAEVKTAQPAAITGASESEGTPTAGGRNSTSLPPVEPTVTPDVPTKCPEAVQALGLCASMGKK